MKKDDMFETITAKEQVMIFLMTKDSFFAGLLAVER